jgi:hypothetical protein
MATRIHVKLSTSLQTRIFIWKYLSKLANAFLMLSSKPSDLRCGESEIQVKSKPPNMQFRRFTEKSHLPVLEIATKYRTQSAICRCLSKSKKNSAIFYKSHLSQNSRGFGHFHFFTRLLILFCAGSF